MPSSLFPWRYVHATAIAVLTSFKLCDVISTLPYFPQLCASQPVAMEARACDTTTVAVLKDGPGKGAKKVSVKVLKL